jgi:hypothetical protein
LVGWIRIEEEDNDQKNRREEIFESFEVLDVLKVKGFSCGLDVLFLA